MTRLEEIEHKIVAGNTPTEHENDLCWLIGQVRIARADADALALVFTAPLTIGHADKALAGHDLAVSIRNAL